MNTEEYYERNISLRCDELEDELLLNTSSVLRLAIRNLYNQQIKNKGDL